MSLYIYSPDDPGKEIDCPPDTYEGKYSQLQHGVGVYSP